MDVSTHTPALFYLTQVRSQPSPGIAASRFATHRRIAPLTYACIRRPDLITTFARTPQELLRSLPCGLPGEATPYIAAGMTRSLVPIEELLGSDEINAGSLDGRFWAAENQVLLQERAISARLQACREYTHTVLEGMLNYFNNTPPPAVPVTGPCGAA